MEFTKTKITLRSFGLLLLLLAPVCALISWLTVHDRTGDDFWFFVYDVALPLFWFTAILPFFIGIWLLIWGSVSSKQPKINSSQTTLMFRVFGGIFGLLTILGTLTFIFSDHYYFNSFEFGVWSGISDLIPSLMVFLFLPMSLTVGFFLSANFIKQTAINYDPTPTR